MIVELIELGRVPSDSPDNVHETTTSAEICQKLRGTTLSELYF